MASPLPSADARHKPVMLAEVLTALAPRDGGIYVDGTFGAGGYTRGLLNAARCKVLAIDRDPQAISGGAALSASRNSVSLSSAAYATLVAEKRAIVIA